MELLERGAFLESLDGFLATPAMVVVIYRDDEAGPGHPLRTVIGDLATASWVHRLELPALTREAVATLAGPEGIDPDRLHQATGGNPFFVVYNGTNPLVRPFNKS